MLLDALAPLAQQLAAAHGWLVVRWQVERLGGEVRQGNAFDSSCTHVIVAKDQLRRTEKVLGALASGKPLLSEDFLEASDRAGAFVAEQRYECRGAWPELLPIRRAPGFAHVRAAVLSDVRPHLHGSPVQVARKMLRLNWRLVCPGA